MQTSSKEGKKVLLRVSNLKQYFPLKKKGLFVKANDGITLDIYEGETFGLVGESGCGKSTLGRTLLQLYRQTDGRTMYYGRTLDDLAPAYVKKTLQTLDKRREKWHELKKHLANVQKEYDALPDGEAKYKKHNELDKAVKDENDALLDMANLIGGFVCVKDVHPAQKLFLEEYRISSARVKEMNRRAAVQLDLDDVLFDIKKGEEKGKNVGGLKNKETKLRADLAKIDEKLADLACQIGDVLQAARHGAGAVRGRRGLCALRSAARRRHRSCAPGIQRNPQAAPRLAAHLPGSVFQPEPAHDRG